MKNILQLIDLSIYDNHIHLPTQEREKTKHIFTFVRFLGQ